MERIHCCIQVVSSGFFFNASLVCGQVFTRWPFRQEIALRAGREAQSWFNGLLLQTTSKISKAFLLPVVFPLLPSLKLAFGLDLTLKCKFFWKWFENVVYLRLWFLSFLCELQKHLFWLFLLLSLWLRTLEAQPQIQWNVMNQLLLAGPLNRDVLLENKTINKAAWAARICSTSLCLNRLSCRSSLLVTWINFIHMSFIHNQTCPPWDQKMAPCLLFVKHHKMDIISCLLV